MLHSPTEMQQLWPGALFHGLGAGPFEAVVLRRTLQHCVIEGIGATPYRCERTPELARRFPRDYLAVAVVVAGRCRLEQGGVSFEAKEGDVFLHRIDAFTYECPERGRTFRTLVPVNMIPGAEDARFRPVEIVPKSTLTTAFVRFAHEVLRTTDETPLLEKTARALESALLALQRALIADSLERLVDRVAPNERLLLSAFDFIEKHLQDPKLAPDSVALGIGVSRRSLFNAFEGQSESVAGTIRRRRIEAATVYLQAHPAASLSDVSSQFGFASRDTFARSFRRHHGVAVSTYSRVEVGDSPLVNPTPSA